jgi:hypothetical protein
MRFAALAAGTTLFMLAPWYNSGAMAQNFPGPPGVTTVGGKCAKLVVGKLDASKDCVGQLGSVTAPDGTVTFIFTSGGKMLGFQGDGKAISPASNGNVRMAINAVSSGVGTKITGAVKVAGFCTFGNPYAGKPVAIECTSQTKDSSFTGSFRTDGKPPRHK